MGLVQGYYLIGKNNYSIVLHTPIQDQIKSYAAMKAGFLCACLFFFGQKGFR